MPEDKSKGPPTFGGGKFPVETELGNQDTHMKDVTKPGAEIPTFGASRFGSNLIERDKTSQYNPNGLTSAGVPTHNVGARFGGDPQLTDKHPGYNPGK